MGNRAACLLLLLATVASSQTLPSWLQGRWIFYPAHRITDSDERWAQFETDSEGTLYHNHPLLAYRQGQWVALPGKPVGFMRVAFRSQTDYWVADSTWITQWKDGQSRRFDATNSCLRGNRFTFAGFDKGGKLLVERREWRTVRSFSHGAVRFSETTCEDIPKPPGVDSSISLWGYFSDTLGREYFSTQSSLILGAQDILYRLDQGRLDTLGDSFVTRNFVSIGSTWIGSGPKGLYRVLETGRLAWVDQVRGESWFAEETHYKDSRGVLWLGINEQVHAYPPGALPWDSAEQAVFDARNGVFPDGWATSIGEDQAGNIWVSFSGGQFAIFVRDTASLALRPPRAARKTWMPWRDPVDAIGRRPAGPGNPVAPQPPRRILFPAPSKP